MSYLDLGLADERYYCTLDGLMIAGVESRTKLVEGMVVLLDGHPAQIHLVERHGVSNYYTIHVRAQRQ